MSGTPGWSPRAQPQVGGQYHTQWAQGTRKCDFVVHHQMATIVREKQKMKRMMR